MKLHELAAALEALGENEKKIVQTTIHRGGGGGVPGARSFVQLSDVPHEYTGQSGKLVTVKSGEDGLEFSNPVASGISTVTAGTGLSGGGSSSEVTLEVDFVELALHFLLLSGSLADVANHSHTVLTDIGTNTHPQIDSHIANTSNPHSVTAAQVGAVAVNPLITGATKTKITFDTKGLVTAGADATTADIADSSNKRYVTDAQLTVIGNTSGVNTGDQTSIVSITGTKSQFNTALTDGDFLYSGDVTQYTDEMAQDAVGAIVDSTLEYVDATPLLRRAALTGEATAPAGSNALTLTNSAVISKLLNGYVSGAGIVAATDTILQAIQKLNGNDAAFLTSAAAASTYLKIDASNDPITGDLKLQPTANSTTTFQVFKQDGTTNVLNVDTTNGRVGIGTVSPSSLLHIATSTTALGLTILEQASADTDSFDLSIRKARGTIGSPTTVVTGDDLGALMFRGYATTNGYITNGGTMIKGIATGTIGATRIPSALTFHTSTDATPSVLTERLRIDNSGNVGIGTTSPSTKLHVDKTVVDNIPMLFLTGVGNFSGSPTDSTNGVGIGMVYNASGNRQFWIGDSASGNGIRFSSGSTSMNGWNFVTSTDSDMSLGANGKNVLHPSTGNVGISTAVPTAKLHITGTSDTQQLIIKANATQTANILEIQNSSGTVLTNISSDGGIYSTYSKSFPAGAYNFQSFTGNVTGNVDGLDNHVISGINLRLNVPTASGNQFYRGVNSILFVTSNGGTSTAKGGHFESLISTSGTVDTNIGGYFIANQANTGVATTWIGGQFQIVSGGTNKTAKGIDIVSTTVGSGSLTNSYGLYINAQTVGSNNWAIYTNAGLVHFGDTVDLASGKNLTLLAGNITTDTTTGTIIGTATNQKLAFFNSTPIVQPANTVDDHTALVNLGLIASGGVSSVKQGSSTGIAKVGGSIFDHYADANNGTTVETDLYTDTLLASVLGTNGDKIKSHYQLVCNGAALSTQQMRIYFGGTLIYDTGTLAIGAITSNFTFEVTVIRVSSSVVRCAVSVSTDFATLFPYSKYTEVTGLTLSNTQVLKITGTAAGAAGASNQITAKEGSVYFAPAA